MNTHTAVTKKLAAVVVAAATSASLGLAAAPADAAPMARSALIAQAGKPIRIGPVTGLTASATKPAGAAAYRVQATWDVLSGATSYNVSLSSGGTLLTSGKVSQPTSSTVQWAGNVTLPPGSSVTVKVVPVAAKRKGTGTSTSVVLKDVTPPVGRYSLVLDDETGEATVTEESLSDDMPGGTITRQINWGMDLGWQDWNGQPVSFTYPELGRSEPQVCLEDQAGNSRVIPLKVVVTGDRTAPTGSFTTAPLRPWAGYTKVVLTQTDINDNWSPDDKIVRVVDWQDGTATTMWTDGMMLGHVYQSGGIFTPTVRLVDEAGKAAEIASTPVTVRVDSRAPRLTIHVPTRRTSYVDSWRTLRGTARDGVGTGVRQVLVRVVEKRGATWYAYRAPGKRWVAAGSTRASAMRKTRAAVASWKGGRWSSTVARLRKGTIAVKVTATDRVGNASKPVYASKRLTR